MSSGKVENSESCFSRYCSAIHKRTPKQEATGLLIFSIIMAVLAILCINNLSIHSALTTNFVQSTGFYVFVGLSVAFTLISIISYGAYRAKKDEIKQGET